MAKADRLERLDQRRVELEADYRAALIAALRGTAAGRWGLFAHHRDRHQQTTTEPVIEALEGIAAEIDAIRTRFGMEAFALHPEFMASRGPVGPNAVGEPKQASAWLQKLGANPA